MACTVWALLGHLTRFGVRLEMLPSDRDLSPCTLYLDRSFTVERVARADVCCTHSRNPSPKPADFSSPFNVRLLTTIAARGRRKGKLTTLSLLGHCRLVFFRSCPPPGFVTDRNVAGATYGDEVTNLSFPRHCWWWGRGKGCFFILRLRHRKLRFYYIT